DAGHAVVGGHDVIDLGASGGQDEDAGSVGPTLGVEEREVVDGEVGDPYVPDGAAHSAGVLVELADDADPEVLLAAGSLGLRWRLDVGVVHSRPFDGDVVLHDEDALVVGTGGE